MAILGLYRFNGNVDDASGNNYNGTVTTVSYKPGLSQSAIYTNGVNSNDKFTLPQQAFTFGTSDFSISLWFNTTNQSNVQVVLIPVSTSKNSIWAFLNYVNYAMVVEIWNNNVSVAGLHDGFESPTLYLDGKWHNLIFTKSGTTLLKYVDGILKAQGEVGTTNMTFGSGAAFGYQSYVDPWKYKGLYDEIKTYSNYLAPAQIKNEYSRVKGFF